MTSQNQPSGTSNGESLEGHVADLLSAVEKGMTDALAPFGLIPLEFKLLKYCLRIGECTATQLAEVLPTDPSRISRLVNRLVEMGLLVRRRLTSDRRIVMLSLTEEGRQRTLESDGSIQELFEALSQGISVDALGDFVSIAVTMKANYDVLRQRE